MTNYIEETNFKEIVEVTKVTNYKRNLKTNYVAVYGFPPLIGDQTV